MASFLITGSGMLAGALYRALAAQGHAPVVLSHSELDICDRQAVKAAIAAQRPAVIFHTAALTRVNYCEEHPEQARAVNGTGTRNVVEAADGVMAQVVYFSTDYVFDGNQSWPYQEDAAPNPINAYGVSKLAGETAVLAYFRGHVVRTSGMFGPRQDAAVERNFFRAIVEQLMGGGDPISVVQDKTTAVTFAPHLAAMALGLLQQGLPKLVHLTSGGSDTWFGWARQVAQAMGAPEERIKPMAAPEFPGTVHRPDYSVLGSSNSQARSAMALHPARPAVLAYVAEIVRRIGNAV